MSKPDIKQQIRDILHKRIEPQTSGSLADQILTLFPDLSAYEVEVECSIDTEDIHELMKRCPRENDSFCELLLRKDTGMKQCSGTIRIPLAQFIAEKREGGRVVRKEKV